MFLYCTMVLLYGLITVASIERSSEWSDGYGLLTYICQGARSEVRKKSIIIVLSEVSWSLPLQNDTNAIP